MQKTTQRCLSLLSVQLSHHAMHAQVVVVGKTTCLLHSLGKKELWASPQIW